MKWAFFFRFAGLFLICPFLSSCLGIGPHLMKSDVRGYEKSITETQKTELLLAMLVCRYGGLPTFVNVTQVISGHSGQTKVQWSMAGTAAKIKLKNKGKGFRSGRGPKYSKNGPAITGMIDYTFIDKSTLTYQPVLGQKFIANLVRPMSVSTVMPLFLGGMPIDTLLRLTTRWIGDLYNMRAGKTVGMVRFYLLLEDLRHLQEAGAIGAEIINTEGDKPHTYLIFYPSSEAEITQIQKEVKRLMHLDPEATRAEVIRAARPEKPGQVAVLTNSALSMLRQVAAGIEVPKEDVEAGYTPATIDERGVEQRPSLIVHSGYFAPYDAYVAVRYRGRTYWVEDKDYRSKQAFNMMNVLCNLATTDESNFLGLKDAKSLERRLPVTTISKTSGKVSVKAPAGD